VRPGMQPLASRTGDAISAFVTPSRDELDTARGATARREAPPTTYVDTSAGESSSPSPASEAAAARGALRRVPTAAPELVRTGGAPRAGMPFSRTGGGEVEIPPWFESAARKMIGERSPGSDISLAEMTLVNAAPATQVAASTRGETASTAGSAPAAAGSQSTAKGEKPDIDKIAQQVYGEILRMIDIARERNGEPFL